MILPLLTGIIFAVMPHNNPVQLGRIVEIDESLENNISANCARAMGEYEAATKEVPRLDAATLLPITRQWFRIGTTIWSDMWRAYNDLDQNGYGHQPVNHKPCRSHVD